MEIISNAGGAGSFSFDDSSSPSFPSTGRGRARSANPQSSLLLSVLGSMNEAFVTQLRSKVKRGMDDAFRRGDNIQPPGVGYRLVDVKLPQDQWLVRESPHLRILTDELAAAVRAKLNLAAQSFGRTATDRTKKVHRADLYPKVLIRPICGGCGTPMILGRSLGKYHIFCCFNALHEIHGCTNRGYKSARIIDEAVLRTVMATLFTDAFIADLTAECEKRQGEGRGRGAHATAGPPAKRRRRRRPGAQGARRGRRHREAEGRGPR